MADENWNPTAMELIKATTKKFCLIEGGDKTEYCDDALKKTALALGADRAILIETDSILEPLAISKVLSKVVEQETPDLIILGKRNNSSKENVLFIHGEFS